MNSKIRISAVAVISFLATTHPAHAGVFGAGLGGALHGVIAGDLVDGRSGVPEGAVIGGLIGAGQAASSEKQQNEAALERKAKWEASEKTEQERFRQQKAVDQPQEAADKTKVDRQ